jgi:hypothetical protein
MQGEWPKMDHPETSPLWRTTNYRIIDIFLFYFILFYFIYKIFIQDSRFSIYIYYNHKITAFQTSPVL